MCFVEVFILMGLPGACSASVVDTRVTDTHFPQMCKFRKICVDSIGVTKCCVAFRGSADSKGVAREMRDLGSAEIGRFGWIGEGRLEVASEAYMREDSRDVIACQ